MTISAKIIADSVSQQGIRITTMQLRYPRFIHAEFMTHRVFSRNASSSRAIPVKRMIEDIKRDPAMPVFWGSNQPGMQAGAELVDIMIEECEETWIQGMEAAITYVEDLMSFGLHKQIANRILEPWAHINVLVTSTDYSNFYALRRHKDAQPEIKVLADEMFKAQEESEPVSMAHGAWHLPYILPDEVEMPKADLIKISIARCARVSYLTHDGRQTTADEDIALHDRLIGSTPLHASPAEHQATPDEYPVDTWSGWLNAEQHGNLFGWIQYRKTLAGENSSDLQDMY